MKLVNIENIVLQFDMSDNNVNNSKFLNEYIKNINLELSTLFVDSQPTISLNKDSKIENIVLQFDISDNNVDNLEFLNKYIKNINLELSRIFEHSQPTISINKDSKIKIINFK